MRFSIIKRFYAIAFLTLVVIISASLLSLTYSLTAEQIKLRQHEQFLGYLGEMFPEMTGFEYNDELYYVYDDALLLGYAFTASKAGYSGDINIMVGLSDKETVKGVLIISQTETPGIGTRILDEPFIGQFAGMNVNDIRLRSEGGQADTITGATVSSKAVIEAISQAAKEKLAGING
ncbi:MAG: FMN-binding protein [Dehalococcoidaceae bacterium]|nr:FMN-binding protein [Dehalococcoidaceae bacterium]